MGKARGPKPMPPPEPPRREPEGNERIVLAGIPVPRIAHLEVPGAPRASFRVLIDVPTFLGGKAIEPRSKLMWFLRTERRVGGLVVFEPEA